MGLAAHLPLPLPSRRSVSMALLAVVMHGVLLAWWQQMPRASAGSKPPGAIQVRLLTPAKLAGETMAAAESFAAIASAEHPAPSQATYPPAIPKAVVAQQTEPSQPLLQRASNEWAYLPASQLDVRPAPLGAITLPFPEGEDLPRGKSVTAVLVLYVSAQGAVDRIEFAQSALPPAFERTAVESFAHVQMRPGMKDGQPRRAMMKIEVEFEAPLASRMASSVVVESSRSWQDDK